MSYIVYSPVVVPQVTTYTGSQAPPPAPIVLPTSNITYYADTLAQSPAPAPAPAPAAVCYGFPVQQPIPAVQTVTTTTTTTPGGCYTVVYPPPGPPPPPPPPGTTSTVPNPGPGGGNIIMIGQPMPVGVVGYGVPTVPLRLAP
ncbi:hypothetical protein C8A03DRAFT_35573 [Achaetomium macrosporum]|uniref:Uncharacterized protein n=1 Tax=Achaetomium macrosporum TaxID=79813 RepID=A0AAN7C6W9_9PEZI|nr:hypothetical protein C8A03DRAFT_35573 [Achaetomium macrosporum]